MDDAARARLAEACAAQVIAERDAMKQALRACRDFVAKVESGDARSVRSYRQMVEAIAIAEALGL